MKPSLISRRELLRKTALAGFAAAVFPIASSALLTSADGIIAEDISIQNGPEKINGYQARPKGKGPFPVLLICHEIFGLHEYIRDLCRRFAKLGFYTVAPNLFSRHNDVSKIKEIPEIMKIVSQVSTEQVFSDLNATIKFVEKNEFANMSQLNMTGFCWGGRITWLYANYNSQLKAAIAWYGPLVGTDALHPQAPVDIAANLKVPVLGLYGGLDARITANNRTQMEEQLKKGTSASKIIVYANAEHGFFADYRPSYNKEASQEALKEMLSWIKMHNNNLQ